MSGLYHALGAVQREAKREEISKHTAFFRGFFLSIWRGDSRESRQRYWREQRCCPKVIAKVGKGEGLEDVLLVPPARVVAGLASLQFARIASAPAMTCSRRPSTDAPPVLPLNSRLDRVVQIGRKPCDREEEEDANNGDENDNIFYSDQAVALNVPQFDWLALEGALDVFEGGGHQLPARPNECPVRSVHYPMR